MPEKPAKVQISQAGEVKRRSGRGTEMAERKEPRASCAALAVTERRKALRAGVAGCGGTPESFAHQSSCAQDRAAEPSSRANT